MRNLRELTNRAARQALGLSDGVCELVWQGDFGKGVATGSGIWSDPGVNPYTLFGPLPPGSTITMVQGVPAMPFRVGSVASGDYETEWTFCRLVLTGTTDLLPGMSWQIDENYSANLTIGTNKLLGQQLGLSVVFQPATPAGTYYAWLARAGHLASLAAAASIATGTAESTAVPGVSKFPAAHTAGQGTATPFNAYGASSNITFLGDTVTGSPYITNIASQISVNGVLGGITDLMLGQVITTGAGLPANSLIRSLEPYQGKWRASIGTNTAGNQNVLQNATGNNTQATFTVTNMVQSLMYWPTVTNVA